MKKLILFLPLLAAFPSYVSACAVGESHEAMAYSNGVIGLGFFGGVIFTLIVMAVILGTMVMIRRQRK